MDLDIDDLKKLIASKFKIDVGSIDVKHSRGKIIMTFLNDSFFKKLSSIMDAVCLTLNIDKADLIGNSRNQNLVDARYVFLTIASENIDTMDYIYVANSVHLDRTTIYHAKKSVENVREVKEKYLLVKKNLMQ